MASLGSVTAQGHELSKARLPLTLSLAGKGSPAAPQSESALTNKTDARAKARAEAVEFEAVFLSAMFGQMFTGIDGDGPFGGGGAAGVWRSFLGDEYAKSFAKAGGIGLADHVYRALIAQQEARSAPAAAVAHTRGSS
jgi:peptidoglycan hydrolase FlgJ